MAADIFKAILAAQIDLIKKKTDFDFNDRVILVIELLKIRLNTCWLKMN